MGSTMLRFFENSETVSISIPSPWRMSSIRPSGRKWNFNTEYRWNMPELNWPFGYLLSLGVMATIATGMIIFFKRKKWL
jgi:hypothetical protein